MVEGNPIRSIRRALLTGTAAEIIPVIAIDAHKIGSGKPGIKTLKLTDEFRKLTKYDGVKY